MANAIDDKLVYLEETKARLKQALIEKGVNVPDEDTFRSYVDKVTSIKTGASEEWLDMVLAELDNLNGEAITESVVIPQEEYDNLVNTVDEGNIQADEILS